MNRLLTALLLSALLLSVGCVSVPQQKAAAVAPAVVEAAAPSPQVETEPGAEPTPAANDQAQAQDESAIDDFDAIYGSSGHASANQNGDAFAAQDPWEPMNRKIHAFNNGIDRAIARPVARAYVAVVPKPLRQGVSNFFDNLITPLASANLLLQGRPGESVETLGRFLVNSTIGLAGLFDPATKQLKMHRHSADLGRTFARFGWRQSRYLELPFLGPRTLRDTLGLVGDTAFSPLTYVHDKQTKAALWGLKMVDMRASVLPLESMRESAPDDYTMVRDAWLARRHYLIETDSKRDTGGEVLPDYLLEEDVEPETPAPSSEPAATQPSP